MKKVLSFILIMSFAVFMAACAQPSSGSDSENSTASEQAAAASTIKPATKDETKLSPNTVVFKDTQWDSTNMYVYYWAKDKTMISWPGQLMDKVSGEEKTYTYDLPDGVEYIIFNIDTKQTRDISFDGSVQRFQNTSEIDVDKSYYVESMDGVSVKTNEIGGSSEQIVDVDKLKEIEVDDTFDVQVTNKEIKKDYYDTINKYGKDALTFEIQNNSGKTVSDLDMYVVAYNADNVIMPIKTKKFKANNIDFLIYSFGSEENVSIDTGETENLAVRFSQGDIVGVRCIINSYVADGKTYENSSAKEWLSKVIKS